MVKKNNPFTEILELVCRGYFFLLLQKIVSKVLPSRLLQLKKSAYFVLNRAPKIPTSENSMPNLKIYQGDESTVPRIVYDLYENHDSVLEFYEKFFQDAVQPWVAENSGKIVGVVWLYKGYYIANWQGYDAYVMRLETEPDALFFCNGFVDPDCRGQKIFPRIVSEVFEFHRETIFYSCIDEGNFSSIRSHEKIGFRRCGATYFVQLLGTVISFSTTHAVFCKIHRIARGTMVHLRLSK